MPAGSTVVASSMLADSLGELVNDFVTDVARLAREAALASVERTFPAGKAPAGKAPRPAPRGMAAAGEDARTGAAIVSYLLANPERMPRDIAAALGLPREAMAAHLSGLLAKRLVRAEGHGRGRRYWASARATSRTR